MFGKIFITRQGYDPARGRHVKDPYLGDTPSIGACRPDVRKQINIGGQIFIISGKIRELPQFVMGGLEVAEKIRMIDAFQKFPDQRLHIRNDGQLAGNIIMNGRGKQHRLDNHGNFKGRVDNYIVGKNPVALLTDREIAIGRDETVEALREILRKPGKTPYEIVGHYGSNLTEVQATELRAWLLSVKRKAG